MILLTLSATSFDWTPRFIEFYQTPTITFHATQDVREVLQFQWPLPDCRSEKITVEDCESDSILIEEDFWLNLDVFSNCSSNNNSLILDTIPEFQCKFIMPRLFTKSEGNDYYFRL